MKNKRTFTPGGAIDNNNAVKKTEKQDLPKVKAKKTKAGKRSMTIKWKKVSKKNLKKIKTVEVQYSTDRHFKTGVQTRYVKAKKSSLKVKGLLNGKTYYTKVRARTESGNVVHVSQWSKVRKVKVK